MKYLHFDCYNIFMNKKKITYLLLLSTFTTSFLVSGCSSNSNLSVEDIISQAEKIDRAELYKKAMDELGNNTMYAIGNSSRCNTAKDYFLNYLKGKTYDTTTKLYVDSADIQNEFKYYNPDFAGKIEYNQPINNKIFSYISSDVRSSSHLLSMTLIQDGNQIQSKMLDTDYLLNYIPKEWEGDESTNGQPLALQSLNKIFEFNNLGGKEYKNVWDFVNEESNPYFMNIINEPVGKNFLYMLTSEHYSSIMQDAFEKYTGNDKDIINDEINSLSNDVKTLGLTNENAKYSLAFIKRFKNQSDTRSFNDDTPICNYLVKKEAAGKSALIVYSKLRTVYETEEASSKNITVAAYQDDYVGIGGYMYKHYLQIVKTCPYPWTACALINFISTTQYGFSPWGKDIGGYCSDPSANKDHSKDGYIDGENVYPCKNDKGYSWWTNQDTGGKMVIEDPKYCAKVDYLLGEWINSI